MNDERMARLRALVTRLIVGVVVIDAVAIGILYFAGIQDHSNARVILIAFWLLATLVVVIPSLRAIRRFRREI